GPSTSAPLMRVHEWNVASPGGARLPCRGVACCAPTLRSTLHSPAGAILRAHVLRRDPGVRDLAGMRVDLEDLGGAHRQIAQQYHLGERARMAGEVRAGGRAALARRDPLGVDALQARVLLRRRVGDDLRLTGFVQQSWLLAVDPRHELSLVPDPQLAARIER